MGKNTVKNVSKILSSKHSQKFLGNAKRSPTDAHKGTLKRATQNSVEATGDLIGNKISGKIIIVYKGKVYFQGKNCKLLMN